MARRPAISHARMSVLGWERVDARPWSKLNATWRHRDGWELRHCGHPTALTPWALYDPRGRMHCAGASHGYRPTYGTAWSSLEDAALYVERRGAEGLSRMDELELEGDPEIRRKEQAA